MWRRKRERACMCEERKRKSVRERESKDVIVRDCEGGTPPQSGSKQSCEAYSLL